MDSPLSQTIRSLRPNVTRDEAIRIFQPNGLTKLVRSVLSGPLRSVAEAYLPFHLFRVTIRNRGSVENSILGLDAIRGSLDPYRFDHVPTDRETMTVSTRNRLAAVLAPEAAARLLEAKVRRVVYGKGFFKLREVQIEAEALGEELYIPYWLGFAGSGEYARLKVLDGVRRRREGAKVRSIFEAWLAAGAEWAPGSK